MSEPIKLANRFELVVYLDGEEVGRQTVPVFLDKLNASQYVMIRPQGGKIPMSTLLQLELCPLMIEPGGWVLAHGALVIDNQRRDCVPVRFRALAGSPDEQPTGVVRTVFPKYAESPSARWEQIGVMTFHCTIRSAG